MNTPDEHAFQETIGYLKCTKRSLSVHKRANEELFTGFAQSKCIDEAFSKPHDGHQTHSLWQKGKASNAATVGCKVI